METAARVTLRLHQWRCRSYRNQPQHVQSIVPQSGLFEPVSAARTIECYRCGSHVTFCGRIKDPAWLGVTLLLAQFTSRWSLRLCGKSNSPLKSQRSALYRRSARSDGGPQLYYAFFNQRRVLSLFHRSLFEANAARQRCRIPLRHVDVSLLTESCPASAKEISLASWRLNAVTGSPGESLGDATGRRRMYLRSEVRRPKQSYFKVSTAPQNS